MSNPSNFGPREREVLDAIIEAYIITGEPVGFADYLGLIARD